MDDPVQEFRSWYMSKPAFTRIYMTGAVILAILTTLGIVSPYSLYYRFEEGIMNLQLWRLITTLFFHGKISFNFIFQMYMAHFAINSVETQLFDKKRNYADFLWLIIVLYFSSLVAASFIEIYFIGDTFTFALLYIWCKRRPFETISISLMFIPSGVNLKSGYYPWIYLGFSVLLGQSFYVYLIGLIFGHMYIFIKDIMLLKTHKDYLPTPRFFRNLVNKHLNNAQNANQRGMFGGEGLRL